jgi:glutamate--cysteine ligase
MKSFLELTQMVSLNQDSIKQWLQEQLAKESPLVYSSVDLRSAAFKVAHVDTNLFPAGFNNLSIVGKENATKQFKAYFKKFFPDAKKVMLIPESFTRNLNYLRNIETLQQIINFAGLEVVISFLPDTEIADELDPLMHQSMQRYGNYIETKAGWHPDLILLNNDLTAGVPSILQGINQPIVPDINYGWYKRKKSANFAGYNGFANQFAEKFSFDSWLINTYWHKCGVIDFRQKTGLECVANAVEKVLHKTRQKYKEHNIEIPPHAFIKAENGTHGVGIMVVRSAEEVFNINKKQRHSMNTIKSGVQNTEVIVQEGVPTVLQTNGAVSENVIYMVAGQPVGLIKRVNSQKGAFDNLNSRGMEMHAADELSLNLENIVATLAALAATREDISPLGMLFDK